MWHQIKKTVKGPQSPSVLRMQQVRDGEIQEFHEQEEVENAIQRECKGRFTLAHSAPIMKTLLGDKLRYFLDDKLARQIITGPNDKQEEMDTD